MSDVGPYYRVLGEGIYVAQTIDIRWIRPGEAGTVEAEVYFGSAGDARIINFTLKNRETAWEIKDKKVKRWMCF